MRKLRLFFILVIISPRLFGQDQSVADSLYIQLSGVTSDSARMNMLGLILQNENDPARKISLSQNLIQIADRDENFKYLHQAYLQMGQAYRIKGDFDLAIENLMKSLSLAESAGNRRGVVASNTALADFYSIYGIYKDAIKYYNKSVSLMAAEDSSLLAVTLLNLGDTHYMIESYDSALLCFERSMLIYKALGDLSGQAYNLGNMGLVKAEQGDLGNAERDVASSILQLESLGDHYGSCIFLGYMSDIYLSQGLLEEAYAFADSCLQIGIRYGLKAEVRDNLIRLSNIRAKQGDYESAYSYYKQHTAIKDSISNAEVFTKIKELETAIDLSNAQAEVDLLKARQKNQEAVIVTISVIVIAFAALAVIIYIYYRNKIKVNRVLREQKISLERLNETKDKFFSIISHDLRGPVNSLFGVGELIRAFVREKETDQLLEMADLMESSIERLSDLLDNLLNWAMQQQGHFPNVPEKVELKEMIEDIIGMFSNMASGKQVALTSNLKSEIELWVDKNSVHTIFRNLINNAIKFTEQGGYVVVDATLDSQNATVSIKDNGIGIDDSKMKVLFNASDGSSTYGTAGEKGLGLGLNLVKEFIEMNGGQIQVESDQKEGTVFTIMLPLFSARELELEIEND
ncbi:MAG: tetratricopeptide repeat protein [Ekhidna sp.]|nr:tetratricopeptide repeat protein [Ekhidna sp.]